MKKFDDLYEAVFTAPSKEEKEKNRFNYIIDKKLLTKYSDILYDYHGFLYIDMFDLYSFFKLPYQIHAVYGDLICVYSKLQSLDGCPQKIYGSFNCSCNQLTSLEHGPKEVKNNYFCQHNQLTSLKGCPNIINGNFDCSYNQLISLRNGPEEIHGDFLCMGNNLESLEYAPKLVKGNFFCQMNKKNFQFTKNDVRKYCKVEKNIFV